MARRRGFTLVETLIALTLLGVAASVMVAPLYSYARNSGGVGQVQARNGIMGREAGRLVVLPFDSLDARAGCTSVAAGSLPYTRCVTVTPLGAGRKRLLVVIRPASSAVRPDSVTLDRAQASAGSPFGP